MDTMVDIMVKVPVERVAEFYSMYGGWMARTTAPAGTSEDGGEHPPWTAEDGELAAIVWGKCSPTAQRLFSILIDNTDRTYSGEELADLLGLPNGRQGVAGVLAWPGRHCFAVGRTWLWKWAYPGDGEPGVYWLDPVVAQLFRNARDR